MSIRSQESPDDWDRLSAVTSLADSIKHYVDQLEQLPVDDLPASLARIGVPTGWRIGQLDNNDNPPSRIAVHGSEDRGSGYGCETISLFRFSGMPPIKIVLDNADCTLRDLHATGITTKILTLPPASGMAGVRSSGYVDTRGKSVWTQYSNYIVGSGLRGKSHLVEQGIFVESSELHRLRDDITHLTNAVYHEFFTAFHGLEAE